MSTQPRSVSPILAGLLRAARAAARERCSRTCWSCATTAAVAASSYRFIDTGDGPAVFAIFILGFLVLGLALYVEFTYEPPVWVHVVLWGALTPLIASSSCASSRPG